MAALLSALLGGAARVVSGVWGYVAAAAVAGALAGWGVHAIDLGTINGLKVAANSAVITAQVAAIKQQRAIDAQNWSAAAAEAQAQQTITMRTITITKEVPKYVHDFVPVPGPVQLAPVGCVSFGLVRLLDAAALGTDPASLSLAPGQSDDTCTAIKNTDLASAIIENYGIARGNAEQLDALIASVGKNAATQEMK